MDKPSKKKHSRTSGRSKKKESEIKPPIKKRLKSLPPALRFVILFLLSLVVLGLAYSHLTAKYHDNLEWIMEGTASACGFVVSLFSSETHHFGKFISYNGFSVEIIDECTGLLEMVIYLAAVISFSASPVGRVLSPPLADEKPDICC